MYILSNSAIYIPLECLYSFSKAAHDVMVPPSLHENSLFISLNMNYQTVILEILLVSRIEYIMYPENGMHNLIMR